MFPLAKLALKPHALGEAQDAPTGMWDGIRSSLGLSPESNIMGDVTFDKERAIKEPQGCKPTKTKH